MGLGSGGSSSLSPHRGSSFSDNLKTLTHHFPLSPTGYFGVKGQGGKGTRNIVVSNPARMAYKFQSLAGHNPSSTRRIEGKGHIMTMADGTVITYRYFRRQRIARRLLN